MSSEDVCLEPALVFQGEPLARRLERILEESWAEFELEQGLTSTARLQHDRNGNAQHQQQGKHVPQHR